MPTVSFTDRSRWSGWLEVEKIRAERAVGEKLTSFELSARLAAWGGETEREQAVEACVFSGPLR